MGAVFVVAGDVEGGELESVEEGSGAAAVDVVGGEVDDDGADGLLDGGAGGGRGQGEGVAAGVAGLGVGDGLALGVVEVAVVLGAEGVAAAAASVVEDVAAAEVVGDLAAEVGDGVEHRYPPSRGKVCKILRTKELGLDLVSEVLIFVGMFLQSIHHAVVIVDLSTKTWPGSSAGLFGLMFLF